ncbi:Ger(x)C family spore germination protein [Paenibacillus chartarius]|uniref:Ger(X)C family spore germination protein n=1 Tax=Paenibacillus chartarius TaxID=747481 RepID=A0ABV6DH79_9BACL
MATWRRRGLLLLLPLLITVPTGCLQNRVLEELGMVVIAGYDPAGEDNVQGTALLHQIDPGAKEQVIVVATTAETSKGIRNEQNREMSKRVVSGQLRVVTYNEQLARKGIMSLVDTLTRDASISDTVYLTVSRGKAEDIIAHRYREISNIGTYLYKLIRQNIRGEQLISCTLHDFLQMVYSEGKDPMLPILKRTDDQIRVDAIALFRDDRMVGDLDMEEAFVLKLISGRFKAGAVEMALDSEPLKKAGIELPQPDYKIVVENIHSSSHVRLSERETPTFEIRISLQGRVQETSAAGDMKLNDKEVLQVMEDQISQRMSERVKQLVDKTKRLNCDPIGLGEVYRASVRGSNLTKEQWRDLYLKVQIKTDIRTTIIRTGVMD